MAPRPPWVIALKSNETDKTLNYRVSLDSDYDDYEEIITVTGTKPQAGLKECTKGTLMFFSPVWWILFIITEQTLLNSAYWWSTFPLSVLICSIIIRSVSEQKRLGVFSSVALYWALIHTMDSRDINTGPLNIAVHSVCFCLWIRLAGQSFSYVELWYSTLIWNGLQEQILARLKKKKECISVTHAFKCHPRLFKQQPQVCCPSWEMLSSDSSSAVLLWQVQETLWVSEQGDLRDNPTKLPPVPTNQGC